MIKYNDDRIPMGRIMNMRIVSKPCVKGKKQMEWGVVVVTPTHPLFCPTFVIFPFAKKKKKKPQLLIKMDGDCVLIFLYQIQNSLFVQMAELSWAEQASDPHYTQRSNLRMQTWLSTKIVTHSHLRSLFVTGCTTLEYVNSFNSIQSNRLMNWNEISTDYMIFSIRRLRIEL